MKKAIAQMMQNLLLSLAAQSQLQELRERLCSPAVDKGPILKAKPPTTQKDILGVCCDPMVLAQQLTHIELVSAAMCLPREGLGSFTHAHPEPLDSQCLSQYKHYRAALTRQTGVSGKPCLPALTIASS